MNTIQQDCMRIRDTMLIQRIELKPDFIHLEGTFSYLNTDSLSYLHLQIWDGIVFRDCELRPFRRENDEFIGNFQRNIPLLSVQTEITLLLEGSAVPVRFGMFGPINTSYRNSYYYHDGRAMTATASSFRVFFCGKRKHLKLESRLWLEYLCVHGKKELHGLAVRFVWYCLHIVKRKPAFIISDRINRADDNGEVFFQYVKKCHPEIKCYFAIQSQSPDYKRLKRIGACIEPEKLRYKLLYLSGALIISSQAEDAVYRPFRSGTTAYLDLVYETKLIFLQHGITKDDISGWLNRYRKRIGLFITATWEEYHSILHQSYGYTEREVKLTGFPRYDRLENQVKKQIAVLFTWRKYLVSDPDKETGERKLMDEYEKSDYAGMFQTLADPKLLKTIKEYGYQMVVMLHPCMECLRSHLNLPEEITILTSDISYQKIFSESAMLITDYSSVAFDFAYLRKPIVYYQMDSEEFFQGGHMYEKGYFSYERDGFGEVYKERASFVEGICKNIENGCQLKQEYHRRIDQTFPYDDRQNCSRVFRAVCETYDLNV